MREAKQLFRLCLVNGLLDEDRVRQVVERVIEGKRRGYLALLAHFQRLVKLDRARAHRPRSKAPCRCRRTWRPTSRLACRRLYGPGITILFAHRPELIGGMRIKVGSDVYDGSVRAGLAALENGF